MGGGCLKQPTVDACQDGAFLQPEVQLVHQLNACGQHFRLAGCLQLSGDLTELGVGADQLPYGASCPGGFAELEVRSGCELGSKGKGEAPEAAGVTHASTGISCFADVSVEATAHV